MAKENKTTEKECTNADNHKVGIACLYCAYIGKELSNSSENIVNKPIRDEHGRLLKGVILNPAGKPKGTKHFNTLFNEILKEEIVLKDGTKMSMLKAMGQAMARKAIRGDVSAFNAVADRLDGKPKNEIDLEVTEMPIPIMPITRKPKVEPKQEE